MILDSYHLDGKIALITGGSRGIGRAIALAFAEVGADVIVTSRKLPDLEEVAKQISVLGRRSLAISAHCAKKEDIDNLVARTLAEFGRIDILVNNAGTNPAYGQIVDLEEWAWDAIMGLNLKGYFLLSQTVAKQMIKQGHGCIINMASDAGTRPYAGLGAYSVSKAGVLMLTRVMAGELGKYNIRVNAIAPGILQTKFSSHVVDTPELSEKVVEQTALKRVGQPEDTVGVAIMLASDASKHVSGQTIVINGGATPFGA